MIFRQRVSTNKLPIMLLISVALLLPGPGFSHDWPTSLIGGLNLTGVDGNDRALYQGQMGISGVYRWEEIGDERKLCFYPHSTQSNLIYKPRPGGKAFFCFNNQDEALQMLGIPERTPEGNCGFQGTGTIGVSTYLVDRRSIARYDIATLQAVTAVSTPSPFRCARVVGKP